MKITDLPKITGDQTQSKDLFLITNIESGLNGTKGITRTELVKAIQYESFDNIKINGGEIKNAVLSNVDIGTFSSLLNPIGLNDTFLMKSLADGKTVSVTYSDLQNSITESLVSFSSNDYPTKIELASANLSMIDGRTVTAESVRYVYKDGSLDVSGLPNFIQADRLRTKTYWETANNHSLASDVDHIFVIEDNGDVVPYLRDALYNDLTMYDSSTWKRVGLSNKDVAFNFLSFYDLVDAANNGFVHADGQSVFAGGMQYVSKSSANTIASLPGWEPANKVYTRTELQLQTTPVAENQNVIFVLESGFVVPYQRVPFATDLICGDLSTWQKAGFTVSDAVAIGNQIANNNATLAASLRNISDGSASEPGFKFSLDIDTGFYRPGDNEIGIATNGVSRAILSDVTLELNVPITGSAAQTSSIDTTAGRLMKTGAFGLGAKAAILVTDYDAITATGVYRNNTAATGSPILESLYWSVLHLAHASDGTASQFAMRSAGVVNNQMYFRRKAGGVWSVWDTVFHSGNLLGTVSQTGGLPTGAVIERGENVNGEYVKFADGTLICSLTSAAFEYSSADLMLFTWSFPNSFTLGSFPIVTATLSSLPADYTGLSRRDLTGFAQSTGTGGVVLSFTRPSGATRSFIVGDRIANVRLNATGRWF